MKKYNIYVYIYKGLTFINLKIRFVIYKKRERKARKNQIVNEEMIGQNKTVNWLLIWLTSLFTFITVLATSQSPRR